MSGAPPGPHCQAARARPSLAAPLCPGTKPAAAAVRSPALPAAALAASPGRPAAPHGRSRCGARPAGSAAPRRPQRRLPRRRTAGALAPRASGPAASRRPAADTEKGRKDISGDSDPRQRSSGCCERTVPRYVGRRERDAEGAVAAFPRALADGGPSDYCSGGAGQPEA